MRKYWEKKLFSFCCKKDRTQEFVARVEKEQKRVFTTAAERESENFGRTTSLERRLRRIAFF